MSGHGNPISCHFVPPMRRILLIALVRCVSQALGDKILELRATYIPTKKNNMVREHYDRLGFTLLTEAERGGSG